MTKEHNRTWQKNTNIISPLASPIIQYKMKIPTNNIPLPSSQSWGSVRSDYDPLICHLRVLHHHPCLQRHAISTLFIIVHTSYYYPLISFYGYCPNATATNSDAINDSMHVSVNVMTLRWYNHQHDIITQQQQRHHQSSPPPTNVKHKYRCTPQPQ